MDNKKRCAWCNPKNPLYTQYHDTEWCVPNFDDQYLYEMLLLESFQAGLSWECVLPKEEPNMLPAMSGSSQESENPAEREAIIRMLFQLKQDVDYLKDVIAKAGLIRSSSPAIAAPEPMHVDDDHNDWQLSPSSFAEMNGELMAMEEDQDPEEQEFSQETVHEDLSIKAANLDLIEKVLRKHDGNRKAAAAELGISERTLYRKLKQIK